MDYLLTIKPALAKEAYFQVTDLLNLEVDLLFFDTTSTYFETEDADEPVARDEHGERLAADAPTEDAVRHDGVRTHGKSKDSRDDLPQVVIGMAVTRHRIPVRVWSWPGNTGDQALIRQVRDDLREWRLSKIVWVADRGFTSAAQPPGADAAATSWARNSTPDHPKYAPPSRGTGPLCHRARQPPGQGGQYRNRRPVRDLLQPRPGHPRRRDPSADAHPAHRGDRGHGQAAQARTRQAGAGVVHQARPETVLAHHPERAAAGGQEEDRSEANLDGKYLLRSSDPKLSAEDIALGCKQLLEVERGWRDMKRILDLRPVYHRREDRIRAHVLLCWLALLLIRVAETSTGQTWNRLRAELQRLHAVTHTGPASAFRQSTDLTSLSATSSPP
ncbi:hypothetical protein ACFWE6_36190 [Streptomyces nigra]|uniref:IS1634 family transposase n=1 Tax=Streptomyces nigra TaxID=1827580 RepID=UPI003648E68A